MTFLTVLFFLMMLYGLIAMIIPKMKLDGLENITSRKLLAVPAFIVGLLFWILTLSIVRVGAQDVGVLITPSGVSQQPLYTGWHLVIPFINKVETMDKTIWVYSLTNTQDEGQKRSTDAVWSPTADGMQVGMDISVSWRIDISQAPWVFENISEVDGDENAKYLWIEENLIRTRIKSVLASTVSEYNIIDVYSVGRQKIQIEVEKKLKEQLKDFRLVVEQVNIRELFFQKEFENSINQKKIAEQEAMRLIEVTKQKEELLKQSKIEKDIAIQRAEGESKALQIKGQSISSNPKIIQLEWINKWNGELPKIMTGNSNMMMFDLKDMM